MYTQSEIADLARKVNKSNSKQKAFDSVLSIVNGTHSQTDIARLYAYFIPKTGKAPKTTIEWVGMAAASKDVRRYLNDAIYCLDGFMHSTDGHRLHIAPTEAPDGYYDLRMNEHLTARKEGWKFPDVTLLLSKAKDNRITVPLSDCKADILDKMHVIRLGDRCVVQAKYFDQAVSLMTDPVVLVKDKDSPVLITDQIGRKALLMPIRIK